MDTGQTALEMMRARKDAAYLERNQVVAALTKCFPSKRTRTAIPGWSDDWHGAVYIDLPTGQVSWHFHDSHAYLFAHVPEGAAEWDGHDTPEKYRRLATLSPRLRDDFQRWVFEWAASIWGDVARNPVERGFRLVEEAVEFAQAVGADRAAVMRVIDHVYSKPPGEPGQEIGGVALTLLAAAQSVGVSLAAEEKRETERVQKLDPDAMRAKHATKVAAGASAVSL